MSELMHDPMFFYAIAFVIFLGLAYKFGRKPVLGWLDSEIAQIGAELDAARKLRAEAEAALADCKEKQARAETEAKMIITMAKQQVEDLRKKAEVDLAHTLARQKQLAGERIHMAEAEAVAQVRNVAISMGMELARKTLTENLSDTDANRLVEQAIADVPVMKGSPIKAA